MLNFKVGDLVKVNKDIISWTYMSEKAWCNISKNDILLIIKEDTPNFYGDYYREVICLIRNNEKAFIKKQYLVKI